jgi:hypothetical protein
MIDREHDLSITKQAAALNISRGSVYYLSRPVSASDLEVMRQSRPRSPPCVAARNLMTRSENAPPLIR